MQHDEDDRKNLIDQIDIHRFYTCYKQVKSRGFKISVSAYFKTNKGATEGLLFNSQLAFFNLSKASDCLLWFF
jgi:hypothetical protein